MSHRSRTDHASVARPVVPGVVSRPKYSRPRVQTESPANTTQRLSMASAGSSGRRSSSSGENVTASRLPRPSGIPRAMTASSQARLQALSSSRPAPATVIKSMPTHTSVQQVKITRDQGPVAQPMSTSMSSRPLRRRENAPLRADPSPSLSDQDREWFYDVSLPPPVPSALSNSLPPRLVPELQALAVSNRRPILTPSSFSTVSSASPSTQFTGSPSPWSASTVSTSWSSASPSILQSTRSPVRNHRSQTMPIPSAGQSTISKISNLKEASQSSPLISKVDFQQASSTPSKKLKKSPAPTPPPRSSSVKRSRSRSSSKSEDHPPETVHDGAPPVPRRSEERLFSHHHHRREGNLYSHETQDVTNYHHNLQNALYAMPSTGTDTEDDSQPALFRVHRQGQDTTYADSRSLMDAALIKSSPTLSGTTLNTQSSRSRLAKFSRLALFGRSTKDSDREVETKPPPRKLQRKGPVAGTGHEGYGKYARKTKKVSADGSSSGGGTDSESSVTPIIHSKQARSVSRSGSSHPHRSSQSDLDDFAATRMNPVVILGGSKGRDGQPRGSPDVASMDSPTPDLAVRSPLSSHEPDHLMIQGQSQTHAAAKARSLKTSPMPSLPPTSKVPAPLPSSHGRTARNIPSTRPYVDSWNTSQSSLTPSYVTSTDGTSDMFRVENTLVPQQGKKIRRSRWNIFRKRDADRDAVVAGRQHTQMQSTDEVSVSISAIPVTRSMPYYAMLESEAELTGVDAIGDLLNEAARYADADDEDDFGTPILENEFEEKQRVESILLPSAPHFRHDSTRSTTSLKHNQPILTALDHIQPSWQSDLDERQPRLAQVGRIPKVKPTTQVRALNRKSFSRPFTQADHQPFPPVDQPLPHVTSTAAMSPTFTRNTYSSRPRPAPVDARQNPHWLESSTAIQLSGSTPPMYAEHVRPIDRQSFASSSSDGVFSIMGPPLLPLAVSRSEDRKTLTAEEDVWKEYDDLIDHVAPTSQTNKPSKKLENDRIGSGEWQAGLQYPKSNASSLMAVAKGLAVDTSFSNIPIIFASAEVVEDANAEEEVRLRRSRIVSALQSSIDPLSPSMVSDATQSHDECAQEDSRRSSCSSTSTSSRTASPPVQGPTAALPAIPEAQHYQNALQINNVARARNPVKHSEMSYASLMISRWLSFGQVLFSPAHAELQRQPEKHVLVIDGLGNDDWSMYCAVTYQAEHAYVYDLKEIRNGRHIDSTKQLSDMPSNFRRRETADFHQPFKFPDNFFSVIVLRFPPVMAESKQRNIIAECRRVLAPGGYLELMLLDLDIVNMGVVTRRAMRDLKTKISISNPDVSLRPVIDSIQNVLGEKGFSKLSRCVVGVPVVGKPPSATDSPVSSRSSGGSGQSPFSPSADPRPFDAVSDLASKAFSLNDLVSDHSDGADAKISKMVSRTARGWWQHCFETGIILDGNLGRSILANKQVLSECKSRASSFKLLIAHAQKPTHSRFAPKRRTMSEPFATTLVTV